MLNFYSFPETVRIAFSVWTVLCAAIIALVLVLRQYHYNNHNIVYRFESAAAFLVLCQMVINVALIAQVQHNAIEGFVVPSDYIIPRYAVFIAAVIVSVYPLIKKKAIISGIAVTASFFILPVIETRTGRAFPFFFAAVLMILLGCGIWYAASLVKEIKTSVSGLSVKQAMDSLNTAILFYRKNGHILLQNNKMHELMLKTSGRVFFNGRLFFETVVVPNSESYDAGSYLYSLPDGARLFTIKEIMLGKTPVTRLTAADVTEQNYINRELQEKYRELEAQEIKLKNFVANIEEISRSEELLRIKTETHDAQNKKLTILLRYLRHGGYPDIETFSTLSESLLNSINKTEETPENPQSELDILVNIYERAGIGIRLTGDLPHDRNTAAAMAYVLREAAANAVIHGYADKIYVWIIYNDGKCVMRVTDNSKQILIKIKEGSGIAGMRRRLEKLGGKLYIETSPRFTLTAAVPLNETEVKEGEMRG